jgi:AraC-like DNA-binding protein
MRPTYDEAAAIKLFRFGEDVMQPGARYIPDAAARLEVWFALSGAATVSTGDKTMRFDAGQGIIIQTPTPYVYEVVGTAPHMLTWCESEPLSAVALPGVTPRFFPITPTMTMLVDLGLAAERRPPSIRDALALHLGHALLVEVLSRLDDDRHDRRAHATADRLSALLAGDPRRDWTLGGMARAAGLSTRTLNRRLALERSPSANELLWRVRVRLGAELLVRSTASSADIADLCGFQNAPHFSRRTKQVTGMTPIGVRQWALSASLAERADFFQGLERAPADAAVRQ